LLKYIITKDKAKLHVRDTSLMTLTCYQDIILSIFQKILVRVIIY